MTPRCPHCDAPMTRVVSGRYDVCQVCPRVRGVHVYVPVGDAPPHRLNGTRVGAGIPAAEPAENRLRLVKGGRAS